MVMAKQKSKIKQKTTVPVFLAKTRRKGSKNKPTKRAT